jgi:hypothetical protein
MLASSPFSSAAGRFREDALLRGRSWAWLIDLRQRLRVAVQIIDASLQPVLPPQPGAAGGRLAEALSDRPQLLRTAVARAIDTRTRQVAPLPGGDIHCFTIVDLHVTGVLLVAGDPREQAPAAIELVGTALSSAAVAHLSAPAADGDEAERLRSLVRLLSDPSAVRTERELLELLADALAIWHDVELRAYVQGDGDEAYLEVALAGADRSRLPASVPAVVAQATHVTRLEGESAEPFGIEPAGLDAAVARIGEGRGSWLLVMVGSIGPNDARHLESYVQVAGQWMAAHTGAALVRVTGAVARELARASGDPGSALSSVVAVLAHEMAGASATLAVMDVKGTPRLQAGAVPAEPSEPLLVERHTAGEETVTLTLTTPGRRWTTHEAQLAEAVAELVGLWVSGAQGGMRDRRRAGRRADQVLDAFAADALARGVEVSALVLGTRAPTPAPGLTQRWLAEVRSRLRVSDLAGVIGEAELGVLLHDTTPDRAAQVAARLRRALDAGAGTPSSGVQIWVGLAGRTPGGAHVGSILAAARDQPVPD